jgi:hypothetical protein
MSLNLGYLVAMNRWLQEAYFNPSVKHLSGSSSFDLYAYLVY